jgi:hypothetical protein
VPYSQSGGFVLTFHFSNQISDLAEFDSATALQNALSPLCFMSHCCALWIKGYSK